MIGLLLAAQVAAVVPPEPLTVQVGDRSATVALQAHPEGGWAMRAATFADALGATLLAQGDGWALVLDADTVRLPALAPFAIARGVTYPLPASAYGTGRDAMLPLALAADVLPRAVSGLRFDIRRRALVRFAPVTRSASSGAVDADANANADAAPPARTPPPATSATSATPPVRAGTRLARRHTIVVDAGHGGRDPGTVGPIGAARPIREKDITLPVSLLLRDALRERGIDVVMTRTTDTLIGLYDRGPIANRARGDLFVSVHVNAANPNWRRPQDARGFETYFLSEARTEDEKRVAAMENEVIRFETEAATDRSDALGFILRDMAQNEHLRESLRLAELVQGELAPIHPGPNRGIKQAGLAVLATAFMPAVLVEIGFGSNAAESRYLTARENQRRIADAIADACVTYLLEYERKLGTGLP